MRHNNLHEMVLAASATRRKAPMFRHIQSGKAREIRYGDLGRLTFLFAQAFWTLGLRNGDRIILCADNSPEWVFACVAAFRLGITVVPVDARSRQSDLEAIADKVHPSLFLLGRMQHAAFAESIDESKVRIIDELLTVIPADVKDRAIVDFKPVPAHTPALIVFTSGTSGASKGVVLTHANIMANVTAITRRFDVDDDDRLLSVLPLSHMFEFTAGLFGPLAKGATIVYAKIRGPEHLKELLKIERVSVLIGVPAVYQNILKGIEAAVAQLPNTSRATVSVAHKITGLTPVGGALSRLILKGIQKELGGNIKFWAAGGAPVSQELVEGLSRFGIPLLAGYGLTEASPVVATNMRSDNKGGTVGKPLHNVQVQIRPLDEAVRESGAGDQPSGEILVKGPSVMSGYYGEPESTAQTIKDGWLHTGDVGYLDADGYLHVTTRIKSTIITAGGYNIQPEELEAAIGLSPAVQEVCVFGLKSGVGEQPHAMIIARQEERNRPDLQQYIHDEVSHALVDLAEYKRLAGFRLFEGEFPKTRLGKVQRKKVAEIYESLQKDGSSYDLTQTDWDEDGLAVCALISAVVDPSSSGGQPQITPRSNLAGDLHIDSFARLELAVRLEEFFGCDIPEDLINDIQTADELVALVKSQKKKSVTHDAVIPSRADRNDDASEFDKAMRDYSRLDAGQYVMTKSLAHAIKHWPFDGSAHPLLKNDSSLMENTRRSAVAVVRLMLRMVGDFQTTGADRLTIDPPFIVVANHSSHLDTAAIFASFPNRLVRLVHPVAAADTFFADKITSTITSSLLNAVPFDRFGNFEQSLQECEDVLRNGQILIMFPEGTRSATGIPGAFRNGASRLSVAVGCPIIPAYIEGAHQMMPKKALLPQPGKLRVRYGLPIYPPSAPANMKQLQELTTRIQESVMQLAVQDQAVEPTSENA